MAYADLSVVAPTEGHKDIRIEQVRELLRTINLAPFQSQYRVALFLDFQKITTGASNALLKTLEEPPPKAVLDPDRRRTGKSFTHHCLAL